MKVLAEADVAPARKAAKGRVQKQILATLLSDEGCGIEGLAYWHLSIDSRPTSWHVPFDSMLEFLETVTGMGYKLENLGVDDWGNPTKSHFCGIGNRFRVTGYRPELVPIIKYVMSLREQRSGMTYAEVWDALEGEEDPKLLEIVEKQLPTWTVGDFGELVETAKALLN
jgi:hypothetical protein